MMNYDVIVIGAGPSGSLSAYYLAKANLKVLILDRYSFPREKPCGGGLTNKAQLEIPFDISPVIDKTANGGHLVNKGKKVLSIQFKEPVASLINRREFDLYLLEQAIQAGAVFQENCSVRSVSQDNSTVLIKTRSDAFQADFAVGADGVNSQTAHSLQLIEERKTGYALEAELTVPTDIFDAQAANVTFDFRTVRKGYAWIFPKKDHLSVGICTTDNSVNRNLRQQLKVFIQAQPFAHEYSILSLRGHHVPLGGDKTDLHQGRVLLVGDAANLADAWLGEGLYYAVRSARIGSESILNAINTSKPDLSLYTQELHAEFLPNLQAARRIANLIYRMPALAYLIIKNNMELAGKVMEVVSGKSDHASLCCYIKANAARLLSNCLLSRDGGK